MQIFRARCFQHRIGSRKANGFVRAQQRQSAKRSANDTTKIVVDPDLGDGSLRGFTGTLAGQRIDQREICASGLRHENEIVGFANVKITLGIGSERWNQTRIARGGKLPHQRLGLLEICGAQCIDQRFGISLLGKGWSRDAERQP